MVQRKHTRIHWMAMETVFRMKSLNGIERITIIFLLLPTIIFLPKLTNSINFMVLMESTLYKFRFDEKYIRAKILDSNGNMAWTQSVMIK